MTVTALRRGSQDEGNTDYFTGCPIGGGFIWFGLPTKIPSNCRICDNSTLAIASFSKLNDNLGGAWGTDGTNINLPDLRGRFPRGVDGTAGKDPDKASRTAANTGGNTGNAVGSVQDDAMQGHNHNVPYSSITGGGSYMGRAETNPTADRNMTATAPITDGVNGTPRTSSESRPKNANVYFVIRVS
jgi:microcystin-dependent protein